MTGIAPDEIVEKLKAAIAPILSDWKVEIFDLSLRRQGNELVIGMLADKVEGGITLEECGRINRQLVTLLEEQNTVGEYFSLELSSPGLDWPLTTRKDFFRVAGRVLQVFLSEPFGGKSEYAGQLVSVSAESIILKIKPSRKDVKAGRMSSEVEIALRLVKKAVQII